MLIVILEDIEWDYGINRITLLLQSRENGAVPFSSTLSFLPYLILKFSR